MKSKGLVALILVAMVASGENALRPPQDKFMKLISNVDERRIQDEIEDFTQYGCERMVVIRNKALEDIHITCASYEDKASKSPVSVSLDNAFAFTFRPRKDGETFFWCNVEYKYQYARFDVYNENLPYMQPRRIDEVYQYVITHDGVLVDNGGEGNKIRALFKGQHKFLLWEEFENGQTDGLLYSGLVDSGMCSDVPDQFNDKGRAVTICYNHCMHLYEHYGCRGKVQTVQASNDCVDVAVEEGLKGKLSAVMGC